ncbi:histone-lysine N-methyltransferase SETMAR-like [Halyomorpha halys]|uniref:histone-lysine N-methyltransferase SETMAR-like n=1 Tax=Halyomorpha halys TaxID=286706 RepID=UPI0034D19FAE
MCPAIDNATIEVRSVIRFLLARNNRPIEIYHQLCGVYGQGIMIESPVRQLCIDFKNDRTNVHDEDRSGRPSLVTDDQAMQINNNIRENCQIVVEKLGYHRFCARWVSKILTKSHRKQRLDTALTLLQEYSTNGNAVLDRIVTGDETWVKYVNCESKKQPMEWAHTRSFKKPRKCLQTLSARKVMATVGLQESASC